MNTKAYLCCTCWRTYYPFDSVVVCPHCGDGHSYSIEHLIAARHMFYFIQDVLPTTADQVEQIFIESVQKRPVKGQNGVFKKALNRCQKIKKIRMKVIEAAKKDINGF